MAANITDLVSRVSDSNTGRPIIGELASPGKALAAASINLAASTNWTTESAIHFAIYETTTVGNLTVKDPTTQTDWKGTLSGTTIGNLTITGGTDRAYTAGAIVEITPTARYAKDMYDWAMNGHNQNGTHKVFTESAIIPTAAIQDGAVTGIKLNLSKTTDANGWTVYDYGNWKEYIKTFGTYSQTANAGLANERYTLVSNQAGPVDITNGSTGVYILAHTTAGNEPDRIVPVVAAYTTTTFGISATFSKPSTASASYTGIQITVRLTTK